MPEEKLETCCLYLYFSSTLVKHVQMRGDFCKSETAITFSFLHAKRKKERCIKLHPIFNVLYSKCLFQYGCKAFTLVIDPQNKYPSYYDILSFQAYPSMHLAEGKSKTMEKQSVHPRANTEVQSLPLAWMLDCERTSKGP